MTPECPKEASTYVRFRVVNLGRRFGTETGPPMIDDVMATGEVQERIVRLAQSRLGFE